jgi:hypothetical protein
MIACSNIIYKSNQNKFFTREAGKLMKDYNREDLSSYADSHKRLWKAEKGFNQRTLDN